MRSPNLTYLSSALLLVAAGCSAAPPAGEPSESSCLERLAAGIPEVGCGVFVAGYTLGADDENPGTRSRPVQSLDRGIELASTGRGRVFACNQAFRAPISLPSGVDLVGGFNCTTWERENGDPTRITSLNSSSRSLTIMPPAPGETGAADGVSMIMDVQLWAEGSTAMLVHSKTAAELIRGQIHTGAGKAGEDGYPWPSPNRGRHGHDGQEGGDACSAATVPGGAAVENPCFEVIPSSVPSIGGKGGDGLPDAAGDGEHGEPRVAATSTDGRGGAGEETDAPCEAGRAGLDGEPGALGTVDGGIGDITPRGWEGDRASYGGDGTPGQGGGGGGGRRGGLAVCDAASKGGASGGSGGAGGCAGRGGRGGENGHPTIGIIALHAKLTVRDTSIWTGEAGPGGNGGAPEKGGRGGRGGPGGALGDGTRACAGGNGGDGGPGGYGGPGRGGDSIGIAYLDEDRLTLEGLTVEHGTPGKGGISWDVDGTLVRGPSGEAHETLRFAEAE
ncbi:hypothetical protein [Sorangium sp. So ce426]|uniref:hypothetical protein n=1 Tax=unclassified Sorangium TaxID=2621164 RepID=UPI003F5C8E86